MKTCKQIFDEGLLDDVLSIGSKYLYYWKNLWILNTDHSIKQFTDRNKLNNQQLKKLFRLSIEKFSQIAHRTGEYFLFYSKSLKQGFVSVVGPQGNIKMVTYLPRGKSFAKDNTEKIVIEGIDQNITYVEVD